MRRLWVAAFVIGMIGLTGCYDDQPKADKPTTTVTTTTTRADPTLKRDETGESEPLLVSTDDRRLAAKSGTGPTDESITGTFGPTWHVYAKCTGGGKLRIIDETSEYRWTVRCNDVQSRQRIIGEKARSMKLRVDAQPGTRWEFLVAEPKP